MTVIEIMVSTMMWIGIAISGIALLIMRKNIQKEYDNIYKEWKDIKEFVKTLDERELICEKRKAFLDESIIKVKQQQEEVTRLKEKFE